MNDELWKQIKKLKRFRVTLMFKPQYGEAQFTIVQLPSKRWGIGWWAGFYYEGYSPTEFWAEAKTLRGAVKPLAKLIEARHAKGEGL
jgi:hypothetical protein